jgi:hypothetical protein
MIDLHKWFDEQYRISEPLHPPTDDQAPPAPPGPDSPDT